MKNSKKITAEQIKEIEKDDKTYSKMSITNLRKKATMTGNVCDYRKADRWACWNDLMFSKYGEKKVEAYLMVVK